MRSQVGIPTESSRVTEKDLTMRRSLPETLGDTSNRNIVVVGDLMLDEYVIGDVSRISPEAPVPIVTVAAERHLPGGAGNVVCNLKALGANVWFFTAVGDDRAGALLRDSIEELGVSVDGVLTVPDFTTTRKTRILARSQHVIRLDRDNARPIPPSASQELRNAISSCLNKADALLLSDYAKGLLTPELVRGVIADARQAGKLIVADPKPANIALYSGATAITPNAAEASQATGFDHHTETGVRAAAERLLHQLDLEAVLITRGDRGMYLMERSGAEHLIDAVTTQVYDVTGAGDTVAAVLTVALSCGLAMFDAACLANIAASRVIQHLGCATVTLDELIGAL